MKKSLLPIVVALAAAFSAAPTPSIASDGGMEALFNDMGAYGNQTGPGAYTAQGMNVVTGGNLFMRVPQRNFKVAQIDPPSLKYGCGGIDLHAGSFSFVAKEQLVTMMKNIGASAVTYAFMLALDSISPQINKTISQVQHIAQQINATNINSCEVGQAVGKDLYQSAQAYWAQVSAPESGLYDDQSEARDNVQGDSSKTYEALNAISDPAAKQQAIPGNVAWRALNSMPDLDTKDKQLLMSLSGTVIFRPDDSAEDIKPPKNISVEQFIRGDDSGRLEVYYCKDGVGSDECLDLGDDRIEVKPFAHYVEEKLVGIAEKFRNNQRLSSDEIAFVNVSSVPVYKALSVFTARRASDIDSVWIAKHSDLIAAEYAFYFIVQVSKQIRAAYGQHNAVAGAPAKEAYKEMLSNLQTLKDQAQRTLETAYAKVSGLDRVVADIEQAERALMLGMPSNLAGNIRFASGTR